LAEAYRPTPEQRRLFIALSKEIRARQGDYVNAARWFALDFSLAAIDAREEADRHPVEREFIEARKREGWDLHKHQDPSGYMKRLVRAADHLIEIDDSALPKQERQEHYRRAILVGALCTDPDLHQDVPAIAEALGMDRSHWPTAKALIVGSEGEVVLDRRWARDVIFDANFNGNRPLQPLLEHALEVQTVRSSEQRSFPEASGTPATVNVGVVVHVPPAQPMFHVTVPELPPIVQVNVPPAQPVIHVHTAAAPSDSPDRTAELDDAPVTLDQAGAVIGRKKRTMEEYLHRGKIPRPDFPGGEGKAHYWKWSTIRPSLEELFGRPLPERFPAGRVIIR
jgi:hypothetical protein